MFGRYLRGLAALMAPADPDGGGGGGAAAETPKSVTLEDVNKIVNAALGARDKRFETKLTETLGGFSKSLDERLAALASPKATEGDDAVSSKGKQKDPDYVRLEQTVAQQTKELAAEKKRREDAENRQRNQRALGELQASLVKAGVRPEAMDTLTKAFRADITFDSDNNPLLPIDDGVTTIDAAIGAWVKSDAAKLFHPAPNAGGSGASRVSGGGRVSSDYKNKPRDQWNEQDIAAHFSESVQRNMQNGV